VEITLSTTLFIFGIIYIVSSFLNLWMLESIKIHIRTFLEIYFLYSLLRNYKHNLYTIFFQLYFLYHIPFFYDFLFAYYTNIRQNTRKQYNQNKQNNKNHQIH